MIGAAPYLSPQGSDLLVPDLLPAIGGLVQRRGLQVGDQLPPLRELAAELGAKSSAVREAILCAQAMGLVCVLPRVGSFLKTTNFGCSKPTEGTVPPAVRLTVPALLGEPNVFHLLEARATLEAQIVALAAARRRLEDLLPVRRHLEALLDASNRTDLSVYVEHDVRFHVEIARLSDNAVLLAMEQLLMEAIRPHLCEVRRTSESIQAANRSHADLFAALVSGDAAAAQREMRVHCELAYRGLLNEIQRPVALADACHVA